jgi:hypothetical protein
MNAFLRNVTSGRAENFILRLGENHTGFYPFGPDRGDYGDFTVRLLTQEQSGCLREPYQWFEDTLSLVMVNFPTAPMVFPGLVQGGMSIGDFATGLMFPQNGINPKVSYNLQTGLGMSGVPNSLDGNLLSDQWECEFELSCNASNTVNTILQLLTVTRTQDVNIITPAGYFLYGADKGSSGTYTSKFLGSSHDGKELILKVSHIGIDQFSIPLSFWLKEKLV